MTVRVEHGDSLEVMPRLLAEGVQVDAIVCDPPYHLTSIVKRFGKPGSAEAQHGTDGLYARASRGFMGKEWDGGDIAFRVETWAAAYALLKPGGHLIAFSGTRTYHRMACAIEDAGFEIRDQIGWLYGSGFPKSHDVSKGIDKTLGAEREVVSRGAAVKRMIPGADQAKHGWEKNNGREYVPEVTAAATPEAAAWQGWGTALKPAWEPIVLARKPLVGTVAANVLAHGTGALNIDGCRVGTDIVGWGGGAAGGNTWDETNCGLAKGGEARPVEGRWPANVIHDGSDEVVAAFPPQAGGSGRASGPSLRGGNESVARGKFNGLPAERSPPFYGDTGTAARFFYSAKADADDRLGSKHPTVKPTDLMAYLCRLVTPPGGTVLDPFAGSGSTGMACLREGFDAVLIEREAEYIADIRRRVAHVEGGDTPLFGGVAA